MKKFQTIRINAVVIEDGSIISIPVDGQSLSIHSSCKEFLNYVESIVKSVKFTKK